MRPMHKLSRRGIKSIAGHEHIWHSLTNSPCHATDNICFRGPTSTSCPAWHPGLLQGIAFGTLLSRTHCPCHKKMYNQQRCEVWYLVQVVAEVAFEGEAAPEGRLVGPGQAASARGGAAQLLQYVRLLMPRHPPLAYQCAARTPRHLHTSITALKVRPKAHDVCSRQLVLFAALLVMWLVINL